MSALVVLLPLAACEAGSTAAGAVAARDSAGVTIVDNERGAWNEESAWRIDPQPLLTIGQVEGAPEYQLYRVRGAIRRADGSIVVGDGGSDELRFYDGNGRHIRSVGRSGEGPGEFQVISLLLRFPGDSLLVHDFPLRRFTLFDANGALGRTFNGPTFQEPFYFIQAAFGDGSLLGRIDAGIGSEDAEAGVRRNTSLYFRFYPNGAVDTIGRMFSSESFIDTSGGMIMSMPFGRVAVVAASGDEFHYGSSESYEIRTFAGDGRLKRIIRSSQPPAPITQAHIDALIARNVAGIEDPGRRRQMEQTYARVTYPGTLPAYEKLIVDAEGNLWVADYRPPGEDQPAWTVFSAEGHMLGRLKPPPGFTIYEIGSDDVLGMQRDAEDVERVVVLRLRKP